LVRMADVTYNTAVFPALVRTQKKLMEADSRRPRVIMGYKERDAGERELWAMAKEAGIDFELIAEKPGSSGRAVEVWKAARQTEFEMLNTLEVE
ncbi:hypothetical protein C8J57DRAFT_1096697, partial [Mycena rebaudengoi]